MTSRGPLRILSLPITTRKSFIYCQHYLPPAKQGQLPWAIRMEQKVSNLVVKGWTKMLTLELLVNKTVTGWVQALLNTIPYDEGSLRLFPLKNAMVRELLLEAAGGEIGDTKGEIVKSHLGSKELNLNVATGPEKSFSLRGLSPAQAESKVGKSTSGEESVAKGDDLDKLAERVTQAAEKVGVAAEEVGLAAEKIGFDAKTADMVSQAAEKVGVAAGKVNLAVDKATDKAARSANAVLPLQLTAKGLAEDSLKPIPLVYPPFQSPATILEQLHAFRISSRKYHWRQAIICAVGLPLTLPFAAIPVLPNVPGFYVAYRLYCHVKALIGIKHLDYLLQGKDAKQLAQLAADSASNGTGNTEIDNLHHLAFKSDPLLEEIYRTDNLGKELQESIQDDERLLLSSKIIDQLCSELHLDIIKPELEKALRQESKRLKIKTEDAVE